MIDETETKVVRYCGFIKKHTIQYNERGQPLYSSNCCFNYKKNIIENRKKDICVTDSRARAVVVVIYAEKLGFSYTGFSSTTTKIFVNETGIVMNF